MATSLFHEMRRLRRRVWSRQGAGDPSMFKGDWRKEVCRLETTLTTQSQTIRMWIRVLSFFRMLTPAHRLTTKVTRVEERLTTR